MKTTRDICELELLVIDEIRSHCCISFTYFWFVFNFVLGKKRDIGKSIDASMKMKLDHLFYNILS